MKNEFFFSLEVLSKIMSLIKSAELDEDKPGKEKKEKVLASYLEFLSGFPGNRVSAILRNPGFIGSLIDIIIILIKLLTVDRPGEGDRLYLALGKEDDK
ncbi:MAG: hypothetical protein M1269_07265 [Chloroflexi bacterium]|nr:hypothetical protein [Chloroflexota bacterium]